ncbi:MAG: flagellar hook basal-body protein [Planctomycetes bacterium]|nr:flagellar hook basal-body protein [Planctomycetota bacterium]
MANVGELALVRGLLHLQKAQEAIAHNLANATSPGYKRRQVVAEAATVPFDAFLQASPEPVHYRQHVDFTPGALQPTGDARQIAIDGPGFLAVRDDAGRTWLTRSGELVVDAQGVLRTAHGEALLSAAGERIALPATSSELAISPDGTIRIREAGSEVAVDRVGLFRVDDAASLEPAGRGQFALPEDVAPLDDAGRSSLRQGYLEQSNVEALTEMVRMIGVQRSFQAQTRALTSLDRMQGEFATQFDR